MLVVVRTVTSLTRLLDVLTLIEADRRVQVVFTYATDEPAIFTHGVAEFLADIGATVIPWSQAISREFDLALAASENDALHQLRAPLLLLSHGAGYQKTYPQGVDDSPAVVAGMDRARLLHDGRVVPAALGLSHPEDLRRLRDCCPDALPRAVLVGDPCHDRLLASRHRRARYRARLLGEEPRRLVLLASTWGARSLFGGHPDLPERLLSELPYDEYRVALVAHPGVWCGHGRWQVEAWTRAATRRGLILIPPEEGWRAAVVAADCVIGDEGSVTLYAAAVGAPVLMAARGSEVTVPGSAVAALAERAPTLSPGDAYPQIERAIAEHTPERYAEVTGRVFGSPGESAARLRAVMYRLMRLPEPARPAVLLAVPEPRAAPPVTRSFLATGRLLDEPDLPAVALRRFPASSEFAAERELPCRHLVVDVEDEDPCRLESATVLVTELRRRRNAEAWAAESLDRWPFARIAAARVGEACVLMLRGGVVLDISPADISSADTSSMDAAPRDGLPDPLVYASVVYTWLAHGRDVPHGAVLRVVLGERSYAARVTRAAAEPAAR